MSPEVIKRNRIDWPANDFRKRMQFFHSMGLVGVTLRYYIFIHARALFIALHVHSGGRVTAC